MFWQTRTYLNFKELINVNLCSWFYYVKKKIGFLNISVKISIRTKKCKINSWLLPDMDCGAAGVPLQSL